MKCQECHHDKPRSQFSPRRKTNKGEDLHLSCKACRNAANNSRYAELRAAGRCTNCLNPSSGRFCEACRERRREYVTKRRLEAKKLGRCSNCTKDAKSGVSLCAGCIKRSRGYSRKCLTKWKGVVLDHYGAACACCGEDVPEFLTIDHINGGGNRHRRETIKSNGAGFYRWIVRNEFPKDLQILCFNCNCGKRTSGMCPHERSR